MIFSFSGCGFLGIYYVGVGIALKKYAPQLLFDKICGTSAGAMVACGIVCDLPIKPESDIGDVIISREVLQERKKGYAMIADFFKPLTSMPHFNNMKTLSNMTFDIFKITDDARKIPVLGACSVLFPVHEILSKSMSRILPADAHERANKKLHVSLTRLKDMENYIKSDYRHRHEVIQTLLASAFIPVFSGFTFPQVRGTTYMDGGFTDNLIQLEEDTITVTPFCGEHDICPRDDSARMFHVNFKNTIVELSRPNLQRFTNIVNVPERKYLIETFIGGFLDTYKYIRTMNLIICNRCLYLTSRYVTVEVVDEKVENDPKCNKCKLECDKEVYSTKDNGQNMLRAQNEQILNQ